MRSAGKWLDRPCEERRSNIGCTRDLVFLLSPYDGQTLGRMRRQDLSSGDLDMAIEKYLGQCIIRYKFSSLNHNYHSALSIAFESAAL